MHGHGVLLESSADIDRMIESWLADRGESVGYCFVCDSPIMSELDILPGTNDHHCEGKKAPRRRYRSGHASTSSRHHTGST
jgi:hypothetical protein